MTWNDFLRKITSRKLWLSLAGVVTGIAIALGNTESDIQSVVGAVTSIISALGYIIVEGSNDRAAITAQETNTNTEE